MGFLAKHVRVSQNLAFLLLPLLALVFNWANASPSVASANCTEYDFVCYPSQAVQLT